MTKPSKALSDYWESVLADEGMAEVSLFDNTGKNARAVQFISATLPSDSVADDHASKRQVSGNGEWFENVNIHHNGCALRFEDTATAVASRKLSHDVASLPVSWPRPDIELLRHWSESGNFLGSCEILRIPRKVAAAIRRRFERFIKDSIQ